MARFVRRNRTASALLLGLLVVASGLLSLALAGQSVLATKAEDSARERLRLAATMAANLGGFEIDRRFSLLEHEAQASQLVSALVAIDNMPGDRSLWDKPQSLVYEFKDTLTQSGVEVESLFINDAHGVQIARAPKSDSVGENYAFRNYFHGLAEDFDPNSEEYLSNPPPPATGLVISNAYVGTSQDKSGGYPIKTAFSVAIVDVDARGAKRVVGRLGMSVRVNDLGVFKGLSNLSAGACLVEMRDYEWGSSSARGLILDRKISSHVTYSVPALPSSSAVPGGQNNPTEAQVKDSMPRLDADSIEQLIELPTSTEDMELLANFLGPEASDARPDTACATVRLPYRDNVPTGWAVLFFETDDAQK